MSKTRIVIPVNCVFQLEKRIKTLNFTNVQEQCDRIICTHRHALKNQLYHTLIGMSANTTGQPQSLNTFDKNSTYLESMSLRNRLLTY